ncbi:MAG: glycosyltransferase family 1 protein [Candidatus Woesebacteria bacterium]|jgi:glycosyltransferase involved in cell wall biosynthesis
MKIGLDCRLAGKKHAGIGRYIENLISRLPLLAPEINWVYFFYDKKQAEPILKKISRKQTKNLKLEIIYTPIRHYSLAEQIKLPQIFQKAKLDLLHVPHFNVPLLYQGKFVVTIHDLLWHKQRGLEVTTLAPWQYYFKYAAYRFISSKAIQKANSILVPAETVKQEIIHFYPYVENKIIVTKEGISEIFQKDLVKNIKHSISPKLNDKQLKQLIYLGSLYPHKNIKLVIKALELLPEYRLKIIGARNVFQDQIKAFIKELKLEKQVSFAGYLTDQELLREFHRSFALVQPSLSEGFGLTGVEAMACALPVLASNIDVFKEIYQDSPVYFNPKSVNSFVEAVKELEEDERSTIIKKGRDLASQYNWDKMVRKSIRVYKQNF